VHTIHRLFLAVFAMACLAACGTSLALGAEETGAAQTAQPSEPIASRTDVTTAEETEEEGLPISFDLTYALYSDYIFRGINFSEYRGEGREKPNHQLTVSLSYDLSSLGQGDWGTIGFTSWFEWYAAQKMLNPDKGGQNLQEVDYVISWTKAIAPIATDLTLSYSFYTYPNLAYVLRQDGDRGTNNDDRSQEYSILLEHNDAWMWKWLLPDNEDGVLNPYFLFAHDVGAFPGVWLEWGFSHDFAVPGIDNLTITPAWKQAAQGSYWRDGFFLAGDEISLAAAYDLTPVLKLPQWAGTVTIGGELHYWNAYGQMEANPDPGRFVQITGHDEFWGGMTVNWSWGG